MNFKNVKFENGATEERASNIILRLKRDLGFREKEILNNLQSVERNTEVPDGYIIYRFYGSDGNGFEAGKTPHGYSITN